MFGVYFCLHRMTCGWPESRLQATDTPNPEYLLPIFRLCVKTIRWPPWFPVVLIGRESGKRDVAKVMGPRGSLWAIGFMHCVAMSNVFRRRRRQLVLHAKTCSERNPAMGILCNFFPLMPLCLKRPDKATLCTVLRFLHFCLCSGVRRDIRGRTADAGGIFQPTWFFLHWGNLHLSDLSEVFWLKKTFICFKSQEESSAE